MFLVNLLGFILLILWLRFLWLRRKFYIASWKLPGPLAYPLIGNAFKLINPENVAQLIKEQRYKYKTNFRVWIGPKLFVYIYHPEDIQKILTSPDCLDKSSLYDHTEALLGRGLLSLKKETWIKHRKLISPSFSHKILLTFFPIFNKEFEIFAQKLDKMIGKGDFSVTDLALRCNLDIACQTTMGRKLNTQNMENEEVLKALSIGKIIGGVRITTPIFHIELIYRLTKWYHMQLKSSKVLTKFIDDLIYSKCKGNLGEPVQKLVNETSKQSDEELDDIKKDANIFIDRAIDLMNSGQFSWVDIHGESNTIVAAAIDTTANAITFIIQCLAMYPECQDRVIEEVQTIFPNETFEVTYEDTKRMEYCDLVIKETLRLFPAGIGQARKVSKDFTLTDGTVLPENTEILIEHFEMHRDPSFWGPTANTFDPMRFSEESRSATHPYVYTPFSKGPRNCIGWRYATFSLKVFMAKIFKKYRFTTKQKLEEFKPKFEITLAFTMQPLVRIHKL